MTHRPRFSTVEEAAKWAHEAFQRRWDAHPEMRERLKGKDRVIVFELTDAEPWTLYVEDGRFTHYAKGGHRSPDAKLKATEKDLLALFNRDLPVMQAYVTGRVKVDARLTDVLFVRSLIGDIMAARSK